MTQLIEFSSQQQTLRALLNPAKNKIGVIFLPGYERSSVDYKFKNIVDQLKGQVNLFRFDFSGHGISDGSFAQITNESLLNEIKLACQALKQHCLQVKKLVLVSHSFAGCLALKHTKQNPNHINKLVFLAPAFNQKNYTGFGLRGVFKLINRLPGITLASILLLKNITNMYNNPVNLVKPIFTLKLIG
ncbi:MAG: alpha/beta fold hydrolase [Candidatus Pacebacteria bacterium]|nr:alpha/beta fold hydrolase [Candidatus Paceibacterota bacterium]